MAVRRRLDGGHFDEELREISARVRCSGCSVSGQRDRSPWRTELAADHVSSIGWSARRMLGAPVVVVAVAVGVLASCAMTAGDHDATLAPLGTAPLDPTAATVGVVVDPVELDWYAQHHRAIQRQRVAIDALLAELDGVDVVQTQVAACQMGGLIHDVTTAQAHDAPDAHPDWVRAVDLARWMFTTCASGDLTTIPALMPELSARLHQFDTWVTSLPASVPRLVR